MTEFNEVSYSLCEIYDKFLSASCLVCCKNVIEWPEQMYFNLCKYTEWEVDTWFIHADLLPEEILNNWFRNKVSLSVTPILFRLNSNQNCNIKLYC